MADFSPSGSTPLGSFTFILHAHLPYVLSHGKWPHGTDWLCEAAGETYIPLLNVFNRLSEEGSTPRVTLGLTPILCEMMSDLSFGDEFVSYLQGHIEVAGENAREFARLGEEEFRDLALFWQNFYTKTLRDYEDKYARDLIGAFRKLQDDGQIEIITSAATHGYLPLLSTDESVQAQIKIGIETYKKHFGRAPRGMWLPECAYRPRYEWSAPDGVGDGSPPILRKGVEEFLAENEIAYFAVDSHLLKGGQPLGTYAERFGALRALHETAMENYRPENFERTSLETYFVESKADKKVAVFARHEKTSLQVWSSQHGYPGDAHYLDFHKKHFPGGLRLWRVTDSKADMAQKKAYEPARIAEICEAQATHFVELVKESLRAHKDATGKPGIVCCPYDAELFGHWWFEGPQWLYRVLKKLDADSEIDLTTGARYLNEHPPTQTVTLPEGSWGEGGFHYIWLNKDNAWTWREIYQCEREMTRLAQEYSQSHNPKLQEVLEQCARELLLMQSSDWQFLIATFGARDYAELRCAEHINSFQKLAAMADKIGRGEQLSEGERDSLQAVQERDRCFENVDVSLWKNIESKSSSQ